MKKLVIISLAFIIIAAGIYIYDSKIPDATITYDGIKVEALKCPFGWDYFGSSFRADYPTPDILAKNINATLVKPQSLIDFRFSRRPQKVEVRLWNGQPESYSYDHGKIIMPKEKGIYVFEILGYWGKGQVMYVFKVEVQ